MRVKSEERHQAILDTARKLFTSKGFSETSMSEIAKQLGGSKATLYNYFKSKEEIFAAVMESSATRDVAVAFHDLPDEQPVAATLVKFGNRYLQFILRPEIIAIHKMALVEAGRSEIGRYFYEQGPKKGWLNVKKYFDRQVEKATFKACDTQLASLQLRALLEAELLFPYMIGIIDRPDAAQIEAVVKRAIDSFCTLYSADTIC